MRRGVYLFPALVTIGNISVGLFSIFASSRGEFPLAAWLIIACIVLDTVDGRIARWTHSQSLFGVQLDSLADIVSFGVAPSFMMYELTLEKLNNPGVAIALFYVIAVAIRLARYNVTASENLDLPEANFEGLPSPASAGMLSSFVLSYELFVTSQELTVKIIPFIERRMPFFFNSIPVLMVSMSLLMISKIRYVGFKKLKMNKIQSVRVLGFVIVALLLMLSYPQNTIFILFVVYLISGLLGYLVRTARLWYYIRSKPQ